MSHKILIISASNNRDGNSARLAKWFAAGVDNQKYEFEWVYLYDLDIPYFTNENRKALIEQDPRNKEVRELIDKVEAVDKIIITTPVWNFGTPSSLKNFIDRALCSGRIWSEAKQKKVPGWRGKTFYLLFTMGAPWYLAWPNWLAICQLYFTLLYYGARPKLARYTTSCGNGSKLVIESRKGLQKFLYKRGSKYFK